MVGMQSSRLRSRERDEHVSYDVSIGDESFNYTFNVSALFYDHMNGGIRSLDGLTGKAACEVLSKAFLAINQTKMDLWSRDHVGEPRFCAKYDSPNGWGSAVGAILFLVEVFDACRRNPRKRLRVRA